MHPPTGQPPTGDIDQYSGVRILKRSGSTASFVLDVNGVAHHIPDNGTYVCNARFMPTIFNVDDAEWASLVTGGVGTDATCPSGEPRNLSPSNPRDDFLLRLEDGSIYIVDEGYVVPLFSGQEHFDCLAESFLVWDFVTADEFSRFDRHPFVAARGCL